MLLLLFKHDSYLFGDVTGSFMSFRKAILVGHVINQGTKIYSGRHACSTKVLADVIIFVYEVPCIFLHYINVESRSKNYFKVSWNYYKCDSLVYYKVRWTVITNCDSFFITKCDTVYYKLRQVSQSAMIITNCDSTYGNTK